MPKGTQHSVTGVSSERVGLESFVFSFLLICIIRKVYNNFYTKIMNPLSHAKLNKACPYVTVQLQSTWGPSWTQLGWQSGSSHPVTGQGPSRSGRTASGKPPLCDGRRCLWVGGGARNDLVVTYLVTLGQDPRVATPAHLPVTGVGLPLPFPLWLHYTQKPLSMASLCPLRVFLPCFQSPASAAHTKLLIGWWTFVEYLLIWALVRRSSSCFELAQGSPLVKLEGGPRDTAVSYRDFSFTRAPSALALLTPWARSFFLWGCPMCQGMFSNIPGP